MSHASRWHQLASVIAVALPLLTACASGGGGSAATSGAASAAVPDLPIPAGVHVSAPAAGVPGNVTAFSGIWGGTWNGVLPALLVVERVDADGNAEGYYIWGDAPKWQVRSGSVKFRTQIALHTLSWGKDPRFDFEMASDGTLHGDRWVAGSDTAEVTMVKKPQ